MEFTISRIVLAEKANPPKVEVKVDFTETDKTYCRQNGMLTVYLDFKDYTISEIKTEAIKAAKELLSSATSAITE